MMNNRLLLLVYMFLVAAGFGRAQGIVDGYPFDTPADPRSMGMGESFVAVPSNPSALMYNPAGLAGLQGSSISYSRRALNVVSLIDEMMCYSLTGTVAVPFGAFAVQYNRKLVGTFPVTTAENPDGEFELTVYSYDVAIGFGTRLTDGLALGVAAKYYRAVLSPEPGYLFDLGLLYTLPPLHDQHVINDSLSVGLSVQNIYSQKDYSIGTPSGSFVVKSYLPEYFRLGIAYALRLPPNDRSALAPIAFVVTGEYRNLLNDIAYAYNGRAYWGVGLETTVFEFLSLRGGAAFSPFTSFDGERDRPAYRYGFGLNLPLRKLGSGIPLIISFNYAVEPLNQIVNPYVAGFTEKSSLPSLSLDLHYDANLW